MSDNEAKLVALPGQPISPEVILHRTLAKKDQIKAIALVITWEDGSVEADWSAIQISQLALAALVLTDTATKVARGELGEVVRDRT